MIFLKVNSFRSVFEEVLNGLVGNHLLVEAIVAVGVLDHLDDLRVAAAIGLARLQGSDCFFCHSASVLFDFLVNRHTLEDGVVFLQLQTLGRVLSVLGCDVAGSSGKSALFHLSALQDNLDSVAFSLFCHGDVSFRLTDDSDVFGITIAGGYSLLQSGVKTNLVDHAQTGSRDVEADPAVLLHIVELLGEEVHVEDPFRVTLRV